VAAVFQDNGRGSSFAFENAAASNSLEPRRSKAVRTMGHVERRDGRWGIVEGARPPNCLAQRGQVVARPSA
jgi:hypothetical protein